MQKIKLLTFFMSLLILSACGPKGEKKQETFKWTLDQFADLKVMRYQIPDWDSLSLQQKELAYYLTQAALCGRDIIYDQNCQANLTIRRALEAIENTYSGDKSSVEYGDFRTYLKRVWFSNGIHHHYSGDKFFPECKKEYFASLLSAADLSSLENSISKEEVLDMIYNPEIFPKRINLDPAKGLVEGSACNFYEGVSTKEVEDYYAAMNNQNDLQPISYGLNSKVVKKDGKITEEVYKIGGLYSPALEKIVYWLEKAAKVAESEEQRAHINKLIEYYQTGCLKIWDEYNVMWVKDHSSSVDYVNGFVEIYGDPLGRKATWEAIVNFKNIEATKRTEKISTNAQWFEDHSPVDARFKKETVKGVSAKVITLVQLGGDCYPTTPIGINLPNADWIRKDHGSKSVTIENITYAYAQAEEEGGGSLQEFAYDAEEMERHKEYGALANNLHTDLHECLGHGSGKLLPGTSSEALKNYSSAIEEARADLFALYYMMDDKLIELGLVPSKEVAKAEYANSIRNGLLTQLTRIKLGKEIEQAHMRCRKLIAEWAYQNGQKENVIEKITKDGKTYFKIHDFEKLRTLFGKLLAEIQRIKSEGDYQAAKNMIETYAVKIDTSLHKEVLDRYARLNAAPYGGFVNPILTPVEKDGKITDIKVSYPDDYMKQMMEYSKNYSFLPISKN